MDELLACTQITNSHFPHSVLLVPLRGDDFVAHGKVLSEAEAINNILKILKDLIAV